MPNKYSICTKTVMDTSDPNIYFDENGISNHYWDFHNHVKHHMKKGDEGKDLLERIISQVKDEGRGKDFDCLIGLSGGADSSFMIHKMITDYGLRPLVFHVDAGWNSELAVNNINNLVETLKLDLFTEVINWEEIRDFQLAMFKSGVPHLDIPQDMAFVSTLYRFARDHGIKYIFNGGNISTESVLMPLEILYWGTDMRHVKDILKRFGTTNMPTYPFTNILYHKFYLPLFKGIKVIKPLNFLDYIKKDAMSEMKDKYSWKDYPQKHFESRFTKFFEGYWLPTRFGYDMRRNQFSSLILSGQMTREDALRRLDEPPFSQDEINEDIKFVASKLEISEEELMSYHRMEKKFYWDYKNSKWVFDIGSRILSLFTTARRGGSF